MSDYYGNQLDGGDYSLYKQNSNYYSSTNMYEDSRQQNYQMNNGTGANYSNGNDSFGRVNPISNNNQQFNVDSMQQHQLKLQQQLNNNTGMNQQVALTSESNWGSDPNSQAQFMPNQNGYSQSAAALPQSQSFGTRPGPSGMMNGNPNINGGNFYNVHNQKQCYYNNGQSPPRSNYYQNPTDSMENPAYGAYPNSSNGHLYPNGPQYRNNSNSSYGNASNRNDMYPMYPYTEMRNLQSNTESARNPNATNYVDGDYKNPNVDSDANMNQDMYDSHGSNQHRVGSGQIDGSPYSTNPIPTKVQEHHEVGGTDRVQESVHLNKVAEVEKESDEQFVVPGTHPTVDEVVEKAEEVSIGPDVIPTVWSLIYQLCSIIAVENLDETLSMPDNLISTTSDLLDACPHTYGFLGVLDVILYHLLIELCEKRTFRVEQSLEEILASVQQVKSKCSQHRDKERSSTSMRETQYELENVHENENDETAYHSNSEMSVESDLDENEDDENSPFVDYCIYIRRNIYPLLSNMATETKTSAYIVTLLDELFDNRCLFAIPHDMKYALESACACVGPFHYMYKTITNTIESELEHVYVQSNKDNLQSCRNIEHIIRKKYPAAVIIPNDCCAYPLNTCSMTLICADILKRNDSKWKVKELIEDEFIDLIGEARSEYNVYATEVAANTLLEKCVMTITDFNQRIVDELESYNMQRNVYDSYMAQQQAYYQRFGRAMPMQQPPPQPPTMTGSYAWLLAKGDMDLLMGLSQQGNTLLQHVWKQTNMFKSQLAMINDYQINLGSMVNKHLHGDMDARNEVLQNNKRTMFGLKDMLEGAIPVSELDDNQNSQTAQSDTDAQMDLKKVDHEPSSVTAVMDSDGAVEVDPVETQEEVEANFEKKSKKKQKRKGKKVNPEQANQCEGDVCQSGDVTIPKKSENPRQVVKKSANGLTMKGQVAKIMKDVKLHLMDRGGVAPMLAFQEYETTTTESGNVVNLNLGKKGKRFGKRMELIINDLLAIKHNEIIQIYSNIDRYLPGTMSAGGNVTSSTHSAPSLTMVGKYLQLVQRFVHCHNMDNAKEGYLNQYAWTVMAVHVLLKYRLIPCITPLALAGEHYCKGFDVTMVSNMTHIPIAFQSRLCQTSCFELFHLFLHYYTKVFDLERDVISIRKPSMPKYTHISQLLGTIHPPSRLLSQTWRISIEDPFESVDSLHPRDLARSVISPQKQFFMFKKLNSGRRLIEQIFQHCTNYKKMHHLPDGDSILDPVLKKDIQRDIECLFDDAAL